MSTQLLNGTVHTLPKDLRKSLMSNADSAATWNDITPLARNEWICWVESVKQVATRDKHIQRIHSDFAKGKRRPCCWAGCIHRERNGK